MIPLFAQYPLLSEKLARVSLGEFPTPVQKLDRLGAELGISQLYIKRDDLSAKLYGGNKPRKLEFILGSALRSRAKEVITFGCGRVEPCFGHCHICTTGRREEHLDVNAPAERQVCPPQSAHEPALRRRVAPVREWVGICNKYAAGLHCDHLSTFATQAEETPVSLLCPSWWFLRPGSRWLYQCSARVERTNREWRNTGATVCLCRLRHDGHGGRVASIAVSGEKYTNTRAMIGLINKTNSLLCSLDASFPKLEFSETDVDIRHDCFGQRYALFTNEGMEAVSLMKECEGIKLDGTYTGKTLAALRQDAKNGSLRDKAVLFWNTLNSRDFSGDISDLDYHNLPRPFHHYFEEEVQPLDRDYLTT